MCWAVGDIHQAIDYNIKSLQIVNDFLQINSHKINEELRSKFRALEIDYLIGMGMCKIDLWDLEEASSFFASIKSLPKIPNGYLGLITICDAYSIFLNANFEPKKELIELAERILDKSLNIDWGFRAKGYSLFFLSKSYNLWGDKRKALEICNQAISFAKDAHHTKLESKILVFLGEIYKEKGDFQQAISYQQSAIKLSQSIGAKGDLAEAFYQLGATYQAMGEIKKSHTSFQEALRLFSEMEAPKQVERVRRSMQNSK